MKKLILSLLIIVSLTVAVISSALAWFSPVNSIDENIGGGVYAGYFAGGDGTISDPYLLTNSTHVYNLAWLQYLGFFNIEQEDENGKTVIGQNYFRLERDVDMGGLVIPPIGTVKYPFVGNFWGQGYKITGAVVSNYLLTDDEGISKRPISVKEISDASVVGFFGVVGDYDGDHDGILDLGAKINTEDVTVKNGGVEKKTRTVAVHDLFLDDITVNTRSDESLIGIAAGYVNGSLSNIGVGLSNINIAAATTNLTVPDNGEGTLLMQGIENLKALSVYSLIGAYNLDTVVWESAPTGSSGISSTTTTGNGASINMSDLAKRVTYMQTTNREADAYLYPLTPYQKNTVLYKDREFSYKNDSASMQLAYGYKQGDVEIITALPLNVDIQNMFLNEKQTDAGGWTTDYYSSNTSEIIKGNNTGYIVGDSGGLTLSIKNISTLSGAMTGGGYDAESLIIYDSFTGNIIGDVEGQIPTSNFSAYDGVITDFAKSIEGGKCFGIQPSSYYISNIYQNGIVEINDVINYMVVTLPSVDLNGEVHEDYDLVRGGINFNISESGVPMRITAVAGTNGTGNGDYYLFSLYIIGTLDEDNNIVSTRGEDNSLPSSGALTLITDIWVSDEDPMDIKYNLGASGKIGYTKKYDSEVSLDREGAIYYLEMPVKPGEYVLSGYHKAKYGAIISPNLLYLDIGANGKSTVGDGQTKKYTLEGINFVDDTVLASKSVPVENYDVVTYRLALASASNTSGASAQFDRSSNSSMVFNFSGNSFETTKNKVVFTDNKTFYNAIIIGNIQASACADFPMKKKKQFIM